MSGLHDENGGPPEYPPDYTLDDLNGPQSTLNTDIHFADSLEKKRLWWRNAVINAAFIASWYVALERGPDGTLIHCIVFGLVGWDQVYICDCHILV